ncbi:MAG TPA: hypothetical protein VFB58_11290 [Chloroflexota bacterium]|nr:hypothetical protein [Chloroflexota bacterium]
MASDSAGGASEVRATPAVRARALARRWVLAEGSRIPGFHGAYLAGSINWLPDDAVLPATSDLDINVVVTGNAPLRREKLLYHGLLLEITSLPFEQIRSPEMVLGHYHLAGGFRRPSVLLDPSGDLTALQQAVTRGYAQREWVRQRCDHARREALAGLGDVTSPGSSPAQVMSWLFATGRSTHVLLTAGLRNPTVRTRYAAVRELLAEYGHREFHDTLLDLLGSRQMSRRRVERHLTALETIFDVAKDRSTSFPFACDISELARPLAIDGSRDLIANGLYREAVFWIAVTHLRCRLVLAAEHPASVRQFDTDYRELLDDLGIASRGDLTVREEQVRDQMARVWEVAEAIMDANPAIED